LHLGSLVAAVGSSLDAAARGARWLVRIEDLDTTRVIPGCAATMLATLAAFGFEWDGEVLYQSDRLDAYRHTLAQLRAEQRTFECSCSRKTLAETDTQRYPGTCRNGPTAPGVTATRLRADDTAVVAFHDFFQGQQRIALRDLGDVIVRRRDDVPSYQLAVVVDDAWQGITHVVRGHDLLSSTPWQIWLQRSLRLPQLHYGHLPLVLEADGAKLAKSRHAIALDVAHAPALLHEALRLLAQQPPAELRRASIAEIWQWARAHWQPARIQGRAAVYLSPHSDSF